jgi:putative ABC transport system substrate-binding protein
VAGGLLATPLAAEAHQTGKVWRIGWMQEDFALPVGQGRFYDRMRKLGWVYERSFVVERRAFGSQIERIADLAAELIRWGAEVFIVSGATAAQRVQEVTRTIPIVASAPGDLVESGLAASLGHPGGNITGVVTMHKDLIGKQLSLLKEAAPGLSRLAFLIDDLSGKEPEDRRRADAIREAEASAKMLGIRLQIIAVRRPEDFDAAFSAFRDQRAQGLLVGRFSTTYTDRKIAVALALKHRLPTISEIPSFTMDGGLMSYGFDFRETLRLVAETTDKIFRGMKASEIPIQQVATFRLIINLKTAKALGLTIPQSVLGRADEVIQ